MKRLFKKIFIPTMVGSATIPVALTACSKGTDIEQTGSIEILSNIEDIEVTQTQNHLSQPIQVKCVDKQQQLLSYELDLKLEDNEQLPNWINITDKGEIKLTGGKEIGTYTFILSAHNEQEQLHSSTKTFKVTVIDDRHIVPDKLTITMENEQFYQYGEISTIPITVTPSKEGVEEQYLLNDVTCYVTSQPYMPKDLQGNDLVKCVNDGSDHYLEISKDTDESMFGGYNFKVITVLDADQTVMAYKDITIYIAETREYYDPNCECYFKRSKEDEGWTLYKIKSNATRLLNLPSSIQRRKVNKVDDYLCQNSSVNNLIEVVLPDSVYKIGDSAFSNQTSLALIEIPGVTWVGKNAFENDSLMEYKNGAQKPEFYVVENSSFYNCSNFLIDEQENLAWIGEKAFYNAGLRTFSLGENCLWIGTNCFQNCAKLSSFKIYTKEPPKIGGALFINCPKLNTIQVPAESLADYKADPSWNSLQKTIEGIQ